MTAAKSNPPPAPVTLTLDEKRERFREAAKRFVEQNGQLIEALAK